jgi:Anti-sigma factor NepR
MASHSSSIGIQTSGTEMRLVVMARRPNASADLKAVCAEIGTELRKVLSGVLQEPVPDGMAELLRQFDQPTAKPAER